MRNHLGGRFFEIGRLQYIPEPFGYKFKVFENSETRNIIALALPGLQCTADGWITDKEGDFETILEESVDGIVGNAARQNGSVNPLTVTLPPLTKVLLDDTCTVANIHIPTGNKLTLESYCQSLKEAKLFFEKCFPELRVAGFCTGTWLLDPELGKVLLPQSNIISFGRLFHLLSVTNANDHQLRERVFDNASWQDCKAVNSLQKAVLDHHHRGGEFRNTAGFILPKESEPFDSL